MNKRGVGGSAGDADYGAIGAGYADHRRPDERIAARINEALGLSRTVVKAGAGTGSYETADLEERDLAMAASLERVGKEPDLVADEWRLHTLVPTGVEFWQGDRGGSHTRLRYERDESESGPGERSGWRRHLLWP